MEAAEIQKLLDLTVNVNATSGPSEGLCGGICPCRSVKKILSTGSATSFGNIQYY